MIEPNAELKARITALAATRVDERLQKRRNLEKHVCDDGSIWLPREEPKDDAVGYDSGGGLVHLDGMFSPKQLRFLARHIEKHREPGLQYDY